LLLVALATGCPRRETPAPKETRAQAPPRQRASAPAPPPSASSPPELAQHAASAYPFDRTHSPLSPSVVGRLRQIAAKNPKLRGNVFAKLGDSVTASDDFLVCFSKQPDAGPLSATLAHFLAGNAQGVDPFRRQSEAARVGWSAWQITSGSPSPLERELNVIQPRYALVQFGTNDIEIGKIHFFADRYWDIVDALTERGVVPILFSIMPRRDRADAARDVDLYNAVIRGIAQAEQVPFVDFHRELLTLPGSGLGRDGIHPTTFHGARGRDPCDFGAPGLRHGYNLRNHLALEALQRVHQARMTSKAPDAADPPQGAAGTEQSPLPIAQLPFITALSLPAGQGLREVYDCKDAPALSGREIVFRLDLAAPSKVRVLGFDRGGEVDLVALGPDGKCLRHARRALAVQLPAGRTLLAVDRREPGAQTVRLVLAAFR
jgi:hypothetical protein